MKLTIVHTGIIEVIAYKNHNEIRKRHDSERIMTVIQNGETSESLIG